MMIALLALAVTARAGEVPFGHADWKAAPTDPVGFAGQGNNWYPGATPPWTWSHTVDGKSQNILWKVPHPGRTDAQPWVIGQRVVGVCSPHSVVCYAAATGKILWQDELKLMTLPERGEVGKPAGPVPAAAKAAKEQLLFERGLALGRMESGMKAGVGEKDWTSESRGQHMSPHWMRLPGGQALLVSNMGNLIDPETGASLGQLPRTAAGNDNTNDDWGSDFISSVNGTLFQSFEGLALTDAWPLHLDSDGKVVINPSYLWSGKGGELSFALSDRLLVAGNLIDPAPGKVLKARERLGNSASIAGKYLLTSSGDNRRAPVGSPPVAQLATKTYDVRDPAAPRKVGENIRTIPGFTPDISAKHFPKAAELYSTAEMIAGHSNYQGIGFNFAVDTAGLTAIGRRIYLRSLDELICIGEK